MKHVEFIEPHGLLHKPFDWGLVGMLSSNEIDFKTRDLHPVETKFCEAFLSPNEGDLPSVSATPFIVRHVLKTVASQKNLETLHISGLNPKKGLLGIVNSPKSTSSPKSTKCCSLNTFFPPKSPQIHNSLL